MNSDNPKKPYFWPAIFISAFGFGAILWAAWMYNIVKKTRNQRDQNFFVPRETPSNPGRQRLNTPIPPAPPTNSVAKTNGMVWIPAGTFYMGTEEGRPDERPQHKVMLNGFWMDQGEVTNEQFEEFVKATGYVTIAERKPDPKDFPGAAPELLVPGAIVFTPPTEEVPLNNSAAWWRYVPDANWRHPEGPDTTIAGREKHPVVQVAWFDAVAYANWAGKRLPTEAEWEYAARGGLDRQPYDWGKEQTPGGKWQANIWQGKFPLKNTLEDGFATTSPVGAFAPNGYGLLDMSGNVWQWCSDYYRPDYYSTSPSINPPGPNDSFDPDEPGSKKRVQRGGSFLCSDTYCTGYKPATRMKCTPDTGLSHSGFRCALSASTNR